MIEITHTAPLCKVGNYLNVIMKVPLIKGLSLVLYYFLPYTVCMEKVL